MKTLNKKIIAFAFLGCALLQMFFILAFSANFLSAQTDSADSATALTISFVEDYSTFAISGAKTIYALPNKEVSSVEFKVVPTSGENSQTFWGVKDTSSNKYYFVWNTVKFTNGNYLLETVAHGTPTPTTPTTTVTAETAYASLTGVIIDNGVADTTSTPTPTFTVTAGIEGVSSGQTINGTKSFWANSASSDSTSVLISLDFMLKTTSDNSYVHIATAATTDYKNWSGSWNSVNIADGNYDFFAEGQYKKTDGTYVSYRSNFININISNITTAALVINFSENYSGSAISGAKTIYAETNKTVDLVEFKITSSSGVATSYKGAKDVSSNKYYFIWNTTDFTDDIYKLEATAYTKAETAYAPLYKVKVSNGITTPPLTVSFAEDYSAYTISGAKTIYALPNKDVSAVEFKVISNTGVVTSFAGTRDALLNNYYFAWNTATFSSGYYTLKVIATSAAETAFAFLYNVSINNDSSATPLLNIEFVNVPPTPFTGDKKIQIKTNLEPTSVKFEVKGEKYMSFSATKIDANNYYFLWKTAEFPDGGYLVYAFVEKGTEKIDRYTKTSISNSTATTTPVASIAITFIERFTSPLSGDQKISISADREIYDCKFKIEGPEYAEMAGIKDGPSQCHILLHTNDFPNGDYVIRAIARRDSEIGENKLPARIENQSSAAEPTPAEPASTIEPAPMPIEPAPIDTTFIPQECKDKGFLTIEECQKYFSLPYECRKANVLDSEKCKEYLFKQTMPKECLDQNAQTQEECEKIMMLKSMPAECQKQKAATKEECDKIMKLQFLLTPECKNANITNDERCKEYMAKNFMPEECRLANIAAKEECDYLLRNKYNNLENSAKAEIKTDYSIDPENFPVECKEAGTTNPEECKKLMTANGFPEECKKENVKDEKECKKVMFKKYGPKECIEAQILQPEECEKFMFKKHAPDDCRQTGITNSEACKKLMFEKYGNKENIPLEKFPIECQKAKVKTADECEKVMKKMYAPKECVENGISDEKECDLYFKKRYTPKECQEKNTNSREECDKIMFKKFGPPECEKAGIEDENECEKFMSNKYADKIKCGGLEQWQCKNTIEERHIGNIVATQSKFEKVKEKTADLIGKTINIEDLKIETADEKGISPLKESVGLRVVAAQEKIVLDEEENLIQTSPVAFMIDSDGDELPDDMEKRIGADPFNKDTDGDGYSDGEEIKSGYNPLGEGKFEKEISPVDEAILQNKIIEHPKTEGKETENLAVENINNIKNERDETNRGYLLNGKSEPDSVVTIYIYSDLPLVVTVKTDNYGNWKYELDKPLVEGEHEVYVVINDNTGKIAGKSKPFNFFVKEAKAISIKDFITSEVKAAAAQDGVSESENNYVFTVLLLIAVGVLAFAAIIAKRRKQAVK